MRVVSGYRSYADQQYTYNYWVQQLGEAEADRVSARPGKSEHQLGRRRTSARLLSGGTCAMSGLDAGGAWLEANGPT